MVAAPLALLIGIFYFVQYLNSPARLAQGDLRARFDLQTLGAIPYPPDNPARPERIELGRLLFFDPILSGEKDVACGTCHHPDFAFADRRQFGAGASGVGLGPSRLLSRSSVTGDAINLEPRNTPTVFNVAFNADENGISSHLGFQFLDGRVDGLEKQALKPIASRVEMRGDALPGTDEEATAAAPAMVIDRLRAIPEYVRLFQNAFPEEKLTKPDASIIDENTYGRALAAYQRELVTRNSAYDRYVMGDDNALTDVQKKGMVLFFTKAQCGDCHSGAMFSDFSFVVQGVPQEGLGKKVLPGDDTGREEHTLDPVDRYAFRTLTLRNVELTPPYMHDGAFQTLEEVVRFYNDGGQPRHAEISDLLLDARLKDSRGNAEKLGLNDSEIFAIVEFLKALTDSGSQLPEFLVTVPEKVPSGLTPLFGVKAEQTQTSEMAACIVRADSSPSIRADPLTVSSSSSSTLLSEIMANQSGLDFVNQLSRENQKKYTSNGAGLAAGDFDNDGLTDVFIVSEEGPSKLYRNLGAFKFEDATERAGLANTRDDGGFTVGAYFADIDNDGDLDLFLSNWLVSNRLFVNNGDGTFKDVTDQAGVAYAGGSTTVTFADYDRDCDLDFFVATYRPRPLEFEMSDALQLQNDPDGLPIIPEEFQERLGAFPKPDGGARIYQLGERDLLYRNNGDGSFSEVAESAGIAGNFWGLSAMFTDIDNDQWPDLYITNDFWSPDGFYRNRGDGTFEPVHAEMIQHTSMYSMGLDFGDINNDGFSDFFVGDMMSRDPVLQLTQHGGPMVEPPMQYAAPVQVMRNTLYLNNGDGSFSDIAFLADLADTEWTWSAKFADIDLDGFVDLLITNGMLFDVMDSDYVAEQNRLNEEVGFQAAQDHVYQFPRLDDPSMIFRNRGDLTFEDVSKEWGFYKRSVDMGMALADFDSDGDWDIVISPINEPIILFENTSETPRLVVKLRGRVSNAQGLGARVILTTERGTQTRIVTSSGGYLSSHEAIAVFGLGAATEIRELRIEWPSGHVQTFPDNSSGALTANTRYTVTEPAALIQPPPAAASRPILQTQFKEIGLQAGLSDAHVESMFDPFAENHLLPRGLANLGPGVAWADVDADGDDDLYIAGALGQSGTFYINTNGSFSKSAQFMPSAEQEGMAPLFWNAGNSNTPELLLSFSKIENSASLINRTDAASTNKWQFESSSSGGTLASADFDGDGDIDLFAGGRALPNQWPKAAPSYLFENQNGNLVDVTATLAPDLVSLGQATAALWLDVDSDRDPDLLVAAEWGPVRLFLNSGGILQPAPDSGLSAWSGLWTGLTASDFDGDGDMDFAAANLGLNTHYRATPTHPLTMFAGDVDSNGTHDLIETKWVGDVLHPLIERGMMGMQVPFVLEKFPSFRGYAEATLEEIFGDGLTRVTRYEATTLAHSVFLNDGSGQFSRVDLPLLSQTMAGYGLVSADFDNDGFDDLYLAGNFSAADMMTVAYEGGTSYLLRGRGDGTFDAIPSRESGLLVPYDARGVAVSDYDKDGWADILVGVNNMRPLLFRNGGRDGNGSVTIRLQGTAANPTGVGARVTVTRDDGTSSTREVLLGSGYLSQDSAALVFGLGKAATATITVTWPDGHVTTMENVGVGEQVTITP